MEYDVCKLTKEISECADILYLRAFAYCSGKKRDNDFKKLRYLMGSMTDADQITAYQIANNMLIIQDINYYVQYPLFDKEGHFVRFVEINSV